MTREEKIEKLAQEDVDLAKRNGTLINCSEETYKTLAKQAWRESLEYHDKCEEKLSHIN